VLAKSRKACEEAIDTAIKCMRDVPAPWPARLKACELFLDRGYGAPDKLVRIEDQTNRTNVLQIQFVAADGSVTEPQIEGRRVIEAIEFDPPHEREK